MRRSGGLVLAATAAVVFSACTVSAAPTASQPATDATISSSASEFGSSSLAAPADRPWTIRYVNQSLMPHNVAIYTDSSAAGLIFRGETIEGSDIVYAVPALATGTYFFRCDIHPEMTGTVVAGDPVGRD